MKCRIVMKTPEGLEDAIIRMVEDNTPTDHGYADEEIDDKVDFYKTHALKWFRYGEQVTLEIDFDTLTCVVIEN